MSFDPLSANLAALGAEAEELIAEATEVGATSQGAAYLAMAATCYRFLRNDHAFSG